MLPASAAGNHLDKEEGKEPLILADIWTDKCAVDHQLKKGLPARLAHIDDGTRDCAAANDTSQVPGQAKLNINIGALLSGRWRLHSATSTSLLVVCQLTYRLINVGIPGLSSSCSKNELICGVKLPSEPDVPTCCTNCPVHHTLCTHDMQKLFQHSNKLEQSYMMCRGIIKARSWLMSMVGNQLIEQLPDIQFVVTQNSTDKCGRVRCQIRLRRVRQRCGWAQRDVLTQGSTSQRIAKQ